MTEPHTIVASRPRRVGDRGGRRAALRLGLSALLVAAGYYTGANIGLLLRFPPLTPSVLWPPNAILTAEVGGWHAPEEHE